MCHGNATLSQLDIDRLGVRCAFPFGELAAFGSLNTLYFSVDEPPTSSKVRAASTVPQPGSLAGEAPSCQALGQRRGLHIKIYSTANVP